MDRKDKEIEMPFVLSEDFQQALEAKENELKNAKPQEPEPPVCPPNEEGVCEVCSG